MKCFGIKKSTRRQKTIVVNNKKIKIVSWRKFSAGNHLGWNVVINNVKYFFCTLTRIEAIDGAYVCFVKGQS